MRVEGAGRRSETVGGREEDEASAIRTRKREETRERERARPFLAGANAKKKQHRIGWEG